MENKEEITIYMNSFTFNQDKELYENYAEEKGLEISICNSLKDRQIVVSRGSFDLSEPFNKK